MHENRLENFDEFPTTFISLPKEQFISNFNLQKGSVTKYNKVFIVYSLKMYPSINVLTKYYIYNYIPLSTKIHGKTLCYDLLQLVCRACVAIVICRPVMHHCVVV